MSVLTTQFFGGIIPSHLLNNQSNPPPPWVISTFGPGGTGIVPNWIAGTPSNSQTGQTPGWLQNLINNHSQGNSQVGFSTNHPGWLQSIINNMNNNSNPNVSINYPNIAGVNTGDTGGKVVVTNGNIQHIPNIKGDTNPVPVIKGISSSSTSVNTSVVEKPTPHPPLPYKPVKNIPVVTTTTQHLPVGDETMISDSDLDVEGNENNDMMTYVVMAGIALVAYGIISK